MSKRAKPVKKAPPRSRSVSQGVNVKGIVLWIVGLPRLLRIVMVAIFAAAFTFAVNPLIDEIYLKFFFNDDTREIPAIVAVAIGMASYVVGWFLVVGTTGETPPLRLAVLWYCLAGTVFLLLVVLSLLMGLNSGAGPLV